MTVMFLTVILALWPTGIRGEEPGAERVTGEPEAVGDGSAWLAEAFNRDKVPVTGLAHSAGLQSAHGSTRAGKCVVPGHVGSKGRVRSVGTARCIAAGEPADRTWDEGPL